jgi:molybdopterin molybdotransferase
MSPKLADDCFVTDRPRMTHAEALALLAARVRPMTRAESVPLAETAGRILAAPILALRPIPAHTNSAVDGYAFAFSDYDATGGAAFGVAGRAAAGHPMQSSPAPRAAVRIFTGAALPAPLDTVAMQEDVQVEGDRVLIPPGLKRGANVRQAGEDVQAGEQLFAAGHVLRPQDLAALASVGLGEAPCFGRLKVGVLSTGDEVVRPPAPLGPGQVYDANAPMILALAGGAGAEPRDLGVIPDDAGLVRERLQQAARTHDVLITSGGASRGEEDHVVATLDAIGKRHLWQIAIKPGRPMTFGQIGDCVFIGLPGNPVAVFVCFLLYAWPMLRRLGGADWPEPRRLKLNSATAIAKKAGRREYWRGMLRDAPSGEVEKFARDGSGLITSLRVSDGLIEAAEDVTDIRAGDEVTFIPFSEYGLPVR